MDLSQLTLKEAQLGLKKKQFSAVELVQSYLSRITAVNARLNACLTITEKEAETQARKADVLLKSGEKHPLLGIPFTMKDVYCTAGIRTTASSKLLDKYISIYDATAYQRLREQRAVILAKDNCDAWGHGASTENSDFGPTKNPWNEAYVAGGSTGGSAAALAADLAVFSIGEDTGGSIRQPASFCNIVGMKVTYGRVSRYGAIAFASSLDTVGPMAKTVEDCAIVLQAIAGKDPRDATTSPISVPDYSATLAREVSGLKIGLPKEFFEQGINTEVKEAVMKAAKKYEELGARVVEASIPSLKYGIAAYYILAPSETSSNLARYDGIRYGHGRSLFGSEAKRRIMIGTYALSSGYYDQYYAKAQKVRTIIRQDFTKALSQVDCLLAPVSPTPPFRLGEKSADPLAMYLSDIYTVPINIAGIPSLALPCGFSGEGLPIGMQIIGPQFREDLLLQVGYAYEQVTDFHKRKPKFSV